MPEEINRLLTDQVSDLLFVSEPSGIENLRNEGIAAEKIHFVGNVMIDTLLHVRKKAENSTIIEDLGLHPGRFAVATLHRPSNVDKPATIRGILEAMNRIAQEIPIVFPVHPRTRKIIEKSDLSRICPLLNRYSDKNNSLSGILLTDPQSYLDFSKLLGNAKLILTDSGGIQEESTILNIPCLTLRENTERPVTVTEGTNQIVGTNPDNIISASLKILKDGGPTGCVPKLWDGHASRRIIDVFKQL
jgi:UDP-N-acetylglucosamine 2-epimerase (non-hydrolysing)